MDYQVLADELATIEYSELGDIQAAELLNSVNVPSVKDIKTADIKQYPTVVNKRLPIKDSIAPAARATMMALDDFQEFIMSNPQNVAALTSQIDALISAGLLVQDDKVAILSLGQTLISRAQELGLPKVRPGDIIYARTL